MLACHIVHERAICRNSREHNFTGDRKKLDRSLTDQHLSMLCFYEKISSNSFVDTTF
jgi:hypothetical protein